MSCSRIIDSYRDCNVILSDLLVYRLKVGGSVCPHRGKGWPFFGIAIRNGLNFSPWNPSLQKNCHKRKERSTLLQEGKVLMGRTTVGSQTFSNKQEIRVFDTCIAIVNFQISLILLLIPNFTECLGFIVLCDQAK